MKNPTFLTISQEGARAFEYMLTQPRRFYQDAEGQPHKEGGWAVLALVSIETALLISLNQQGGFFRFVFESIFLCAFLAGLNLLMLKMGSTVATLFQKKGEWKNGFTLLNIGLWPALLYFPAGFLSWFTGGLAAVKLVFLLIAFLWVFKNWREALEVVFELNKVQSGLASYAAFLVGGAAVVLAGYLALIAALTGGPF